MRTCLNQSCFPGLDVVKFVETAARAGVGSIELRAMDPREPPAPMAAAVRSVNVRVEAVNALMDWALPDDPDPRPRFEYLLSVAQAVDAPAIVCVAPIRTGELPPRERILQTATRRLAELMDLAHGTGVRLALEQVGRSTTRLGARSGIRWLADAWSVVQLAGPEARLTIDSYNLATAGEGFQTIQDIPGERIAIAQLVDRQAGTAGRALPGDGDLPLDGFIDALRATGYDGAVSVEIFPTVAWPDPVAFARRAIESVEKYVRFAAVD